MNNRRVRIASVLLSERHVVDLDRLDKQQIETQCEIFQVFLVRSLTG